MAHDQDQRRRSLGEDKAKDLHDNEEGAFRKRDKHRELNRFSKIVDPETKQRFKNTRPSQQSEFGKRS